MVFRPIVCKVEFSRSPIESKLLLAFSVTEPVESHVDGFGSFRLYLSIDDSISHCIVSLYRRRRLFVSHFREDDSDVYCFSCHDVESGEFCFGGGGHDVFDDVGNVENGAVVLRNVGTVGEEEMATSPATGFRFTEVACVAVDSQFHCTCVVGDDGVVLGGEIVKELFGLSHGIGCGRC